MLKYVYAQKVSFSFSVKFRGEINFIETNHNPNIIPRDFFNDFSNTLCPIMIVCLKSLINHYVLDTYAFINHTICRQISTSTFQNMHLNNSKYLHQTSIFPKT
jgi:hypothetical protein